MSSSNTDPNIPLPNGVCYIYQRLPQELRDLIVDFAYTSPGDIPVISKRRWLWRQKNDHECLNCSRRTKRCSRKLCYKTAPYLPLNAFGVCKSWRSLALPIFISTNTFHFSCMLELGLFLRSSPYARQNIRSIHLDLLCRNGPLSASKRGLKYGIDRGALSLLAQCPNLSRLRISTHPFIKMELVKKLKRLRGLNVFAMTLLTPPGDGASGRRLGYEMRCVRDEIREVVVKKKCL